MTSEYGDIDAVQAAEQQAQAQQYQAAQQLAQSQAQAEQSSQQHAASMAAAPAAQQLLGQVHPGLLQAQNQAVPPDDLPQEHHDATIAQAARHEKLNVPNFTFEGTIR